MGYIDICSASRLPFPFKESRAVLFDIDNGKGLIAEMPSLREVCCHRARHGTHNEDGMFLPDGSEDTDDNWINTTNRIIVREDVYEAYLKEANFNSEEIPGIYHFLRRAFTTLVDNEYARARTMKSIYDEAGYKADMSPNDAYNLADTTHLTYQIMESLNEFYYDSQASEPSRDTWSMLRMFKGDAAGRAEKIVEMSCRLSEDEFAIKSVHLLNEMAFIHICDMSGTVLTPNIGVADCNTDISWRLRKTEQDIMKKDIKEEHIFDDMEP